MGIPTIPDIVDEEPTDEIRETEKTEEEVANPPLVDSGDFE